MIKIIKIFLRIFSQILIKFNLYNFAQLISSIRASILIKKLVKVSFDGEDWIYRWKNSAAVNSTCYYDPNFNYSDLDLFFFKYKPKSGDTILNIGVENGAEIPEFCKLAGYNGKVFAIEADPSCCRRLEKLKKILNLNNLTIINVAVGSSESMIKLSQEKNEMSNSVIRNQSCKINFIEVKQQKLDNILEPFQLNKIDYVKSNIEGAEVGLLNGLSNTTIRIENWCISCHDFKGEDYKSYKFVLSWLKKSNYETSNYQPYSKTKIWRNYYLYGSIK